jgi:hypothetical protein
MKKCVIVFLLFLLFSCATGPIHIATNESESIKSTYEEAKLKELYTKYNELLRQIYLRLNRSNIGIYKEGIGFTTLHDENNEKYYYLMVHIRPSDVYFDGNTTKPEQRFSHVLQQHFKKYLNYIQKEDLNKDGIDGLAFGIYWPVRDYSQCNQYGGFLEYAIIYFQKDDVWDIFENRKTFVEVVQNTEVITSLNLGPPQSVRPVF